MKSVWCVCLVSRTKRYCEDVLSNVQDDYFMLVRACRLEMGRRHVVQYIDVCTYQA